MLMWVAGQLAGSWLAVGWQLGEANADVGGWAVGWANVDVGGWAVGWAVVEANVDVGGWVDMCQLGGLATLAQ